jgi:hypothetical protein
MPGPSPFDHRPDTELGQALRESLTQPGEAQFVRRVVTAAEHVYGSAVVTPWLNVLTAWARPGLVAAMFLVALVAFSAGLWIGRSSGTTVATPVVDPLADSGQLGVPALMAGEEAPDMDVVLAVAMRR